LLSYHLEIKDYFDFHATLALLLKDCKHKKNTVAIIGAAKSTGKRPCQPGDSNVGN
jgi:hypothetical protein